MTYKTKSTKLSIMRGLLVISLMSFTLMSVVAQHSFNSAGGNTETRCVKISYSIGQVFHNTYSESTQGVTEGVHQPYEITVTSIGEFDNIELACMAYPNPTTDYLTLSIDKFDIKDLSYQLYNMQGVVLQNKKITGTKTQIDMKNIAPAIYFIKIIQKNRLIKTFKVIKNDN